LFIERQFGNAIERMREDSGRKPGKNTNKSSGRTQTIHRTKGPPAFSNCVWERNGVLVSPSFFSEKPLLGPGLWPLLIPY
jgi:hypothetical protein